MLKLFNFGCIILKRSVAMSYICLIGNENGIVAGSDSRETIAPNRIFG